MKTGQRLPPNIESVTSYRGDFCLTIGWLNREQRVAKVKEQRLWRCKRCDEYFQTLAEAREHKHG